MTLDEQIEILQAKKAGKKIERLEEDCNWEQFDGEEFDFQHESYRIAKEPEVRWLWFDDEGDAASFGNADCDDDNWDHKLKITFPVDGGKPEVEVVK